MCACVICDTRERVAEKIHSTEIHSTENQQPPTQTDTPRESLKTTETAGQKAKKKTFQMGYTKQKECE